MLEWGCKGFGQVPYRVTRALPDAAREYSRLRAADVGAAAGGPDDMVDPGAAMRLLQIRTVSAVRVRVLQIQLDA